MANSALLIGFHNWLCWVWVYVATNVWCLNCLMTNVSLTSHSQRAFTCIQLKVIHFGCHLNWKVVFQQCTCRAFVSDLRGVISQRRRSSSRRRGVYCSWIPELRLQDNWLGNWVTFPPLSSTRVSDISGKISDPCAKTSTMTFRWRGICFPASGHVRTHNGDPQQWD